MEENAALTTRGFDHAELVKDLRKQVAALEDDLRERSDEEPFASALKTEYDEARKAERTAATYGAWRDERVTQVAVAWVLGTVFVRFCEDNGLIEWPFIAGPGDRLADAVERHEAFFKEHPEKNDRDWIVAAFDYLASSHKTVEGLFDKRYNPLWEITPSFEQATALLIFWRRRGDDGEIRYDFTDDDWDTRFLGDLYQDLSEHARKTYALLQTPEFVEEFILELTLEPAVEEFGLRGLRTIDPACGSGHFLLGIFHRLLAKWRATEPASDNWKLISLALDSVHGCDKNPFAASIARFRLLIAALRAAGKPPLNRASTFPINVAVGDSLLHGRGAPGVQGNLFEPTEAYTYRTENVTDYHSVDLLGKSSYHVVVGNPPYITPKDKQENENYRRGYDACSGAYALSVPFAQRLFNLAVRAHDPERNSGYVGQITANSFMKREFGKRLIEHFLPSVRLTHVIDSSGAYIPGHGTPTVILVGRNQPYRSSDRVRSVLGIQGEPSSPQNPAHGAVWSAIITQVTKPGSESPWISVADLDSHRFTQHPWSISGGGASELSEALSLAAPQKLSSRVSEIGFGAVTREDNAYMLGEGALRRANVDASHQRAIVEGEVIRDYLITEPVMSLWPYDPITLSPCRSAPVEVLLWPHRTILRNRVAYGSTQLQRGLEWFEYSMFFASRYSNPYSIAFSFVTTHNHFTLDRGGKIFKQSAPIIKLPDEASENEHLELLGLLNSSTACFWLKQVSHNKGEGGGARVDAGYATMGSEAWKNTFEFTGTKLREFPLPGQLPLDLGQRLDHLAQQLAEQEPSAVASSLTPTRHLLDSARIEHGRIRNLMIALQEELDWKVYGSFNLLDNRDTSKLTASDLKSIPEINLGERAFEIVLARKAVAGEVETTWFTRHGSTPTLEIPDRWPQWYKEIVQARIDTIAGRRDIALIERPEYKRRWTTEPWERREAEALCNWLLDRCEKPELWFALRDGMKHPRTLTISQLADQFRDDADMNSVAQLYATDHLKKRDLTLAQILEQVIADQHVPYLAALRYKDSGLRKREQWEEVWELQREEDRTGKRLDIPVPPKYGSGDFRKTSYWSQRGKLDVPKERFISYPDASPDADPTLLLGWAGWDHKDQAQALVNTVNDRTEQSGWSAERLTPLLAGLLEVLPWVKQWHGEYDDEWGGVPADEYDAYLTEQRAKHQLTEDDLRAWRPAAPTRGRRAAKKD
ncbi:BREX-2 system adenine-specific DNA-methyltransferase PglX [Saccharothrix hoggarensis]|uniref:site-specific DNA-methyltransferase (adenine-specific) n=1 Tax=Saccharothrix hoggarensis TaxID=913853 RepID=A0ABW3QM78_9PSEU